MSTWDYTKMNHGPRIELGLSPNEYCVLDLYYQSQTNKDYSVDGWCENSYAQISTMLKFSKGTVHKMVDRFVRQGLMEVNPANPTQKRTTKAWYSLAYEDVQKVNVQKVNGNGSVQKVNGNGSVQKVNDDRSKRKRTKPELKIEYLLATSDAQAQTFDQDELLDLDAQSEALEKEKSSAKKEKDRGVTPETARRRDAIIAQLNGQQAPTADEPQQDQSIVVMEVTERVMAELETDLGRAKLATAYLRAGMKDGAVLNLYAAVYACAEIELRTKGRLPHDIFSRIPGYLKTQASIERNDAEREKLNKDRRTAQNSTNYAKPNRNGATRQPVVSDEQALRVAKRALEQELSGAGESWY